MEFNEKDDLVIKIQNKRVEVDSAMLAVGAIASVGPDKALQKIKEAEDLLKEYKELVGE